MAKYMKKGPLGRLIETDINDPELTEIKLSVEEYDYFFEEIDELKKEIKRIKKDANEKIRKIKEESDENVEDMREFYRKRSENQVKTLIDEKNQLIDKLNIVNGKVVELEVMLEEEASKNENLLRICKERANSLRGISPKKEKDGYVVLSVVQDIKKEEWRLQLQTPYNCGMATESIKKTIEEDLKIVLNELECSRIGEISYSIDVRVHLWNVNLSVDKEPKLSVERLPVIAIKKK